MTLVIVRVANLAGIPLPRTLLSAVFELLKNVPGAFLKPVTISIKFDPSKLKEGEIPSIFYYDEQKKEWVELECAAGAAIAMGHAIPAVAGIHAVPAVAGIPHSPQSPGLPVPRFIPPAWPGKTP
jgi:hypothetical protein